MKIYLIIIFLGFFNYTCGCQAKMDSIKEIGFQYLNTSEIFYSKNLDECIHYTLLAANCFAEAGAQDMYLFSMLGIMNLEFSRRNFSKYKSLYKWHLSLTKTTPFIKNNIRASIYNSYALYQSKIGNLREAKLLILDALNLINDSDYLLKYVFHYNLAGIFYLEQDYFRSKEEFELALNYSKKVESSMDKIQVKNDMPRLLVDLARSKIFLNEDNSSENLFEVIRLFDQFPELEKNNFQIKNELIWNLLKTELDEEALSVFNTVKYEDLKSYSDSLNFYWSKVKIFLKRDDKQFEKELISLRRLILEDETLDGKTEFLKFLIFKFGLAINNELVDFDLENEYQNILRNSRTELSAKNRSFFFDLLKIKIEYDCLVKTDIDQQDFFLFLKSFYSHLLHIRTPSSKIFLSGDIDRIQNSLIKNIHLVEDVNDVVFELSELNKSPILFSESNEEERNDLFLNTEIKEEEYLQKKLINYLTEELEITNKLYNGNMEDSLLVSSLKSELSKVKNNYDIILNKIDSLYPEYSNFVLNPKTYTTSEIQATLSPDEVLLESVVTDSACHLFFITNEKIDQRKIDGQDFLDLQKAVEIHSNNISLGEGVEKEIDIISGFFDKQDLSFLVGKKRLIIVPDGFLYKIPFEVLKINGKPLYEDYAISYQYSYKLYLVLKEQGKDRKYQKDFIGVSFPVTETFASAERASRLCDDLVVSKLACTKKEIKTIEGIIGAEQTKSDLTTTQFIDQVEGSRIIHIASHACPDEENHQLSRIHFKDDYLTNYDISAMNIDADIAVLSACETGSGKILDGEGAMTIAKAFFQAGVHTNIVSLWKVDDCSTAQLMSYFYEHLYQGEDSDVALQNAKKDFLVNSHPQYHDPYYWAGFIHMGDTDPVFKNAARNKNIYFVLAGLLLLSFSFVGVKAMVKKSAA